MEIERHFFVNKEFENPETDQKVPKTKLSSRICQKDGAENCTEIVREMKI